MGDRFGPYELLEPLASGGMARVYRARMTGALGFEKIVALKFMLPGFANDPTAVKMFIDEARLAATLTHANIIGILDFGERGGEYYIAMEYVSGANVRVLLKRALETSRLPPPSLAAHVVAEAARGLEYAHTKTDAQGRPLGIVHRDVSPQNIVVSWSGDVKILDFGIARSRQKSFETAAGTIKGKYSYMSPEQASGEGIDHRSDLFSLGAVLYELLCGEKAFPQPGHAALERVRRAEFPPLESRRPGTPPALLAIVRRAMARDPDGRYPSAGAMHDELQLYLSEERARGAIDADAAGLARWAENLFEVSENDVPREAPPSFFSGPEPALLPGWESDSPAAPPEPRRPAPTTRASLTFSGADVDEQAGGEAEEEPIIDGDDLPTRVTLVPSATGAPVPPAPAPAPPDMGWVLPGPPAFAGAPPPAPVPPPPVPLAPSGFAPPPVPRPPAVRATSIEPAVPPVAAPAAAPGAAPSAASAAAPSAASAAAFPGAPPPPARPAAPPGAASPPFVAPPPAVRPAAPDLAAPATEPRPGDRPSRERVSRSSGVAATRPSPPVVPAAASAPIPPAPGLAPAEGRAPLDRRHAAILFLGAAVGAGIVTTIFHLAVGPREVPAPTPPPTPIPSPSPIPTEALVLDTAQVAVVTTGSAIDFSDPLTARPGEKAIGLLSVSSEPAGGQVFVDGKPISDAPALIPNVPAPRRYLVEVRLDGYFPWSREVDVIDDGAEQVVARLVPLEIPGRLKVTIPRGGTAFVDGRLLGRGPASAEVEVSPGKHQLRLKDLNGMILREYEVLVAKGRTTEIELPPP